MPITASAWEAGDKKSEQGAGWNCPGGWVQGSSPEASERGVREHAEIYDLPVQQAGTSTDGPGNFMFHLCLSMCTFIHLWLQIKYSARLNMCLYLPLSLGDLQFAKRKRRGKAAPWEPGERQSKDWETARGHIFTGAHSKHAFVYWSWKDKKTVLWSVQWLEWSSTAKY